MQELGIKDTGWIPNNAMRDTASATAQENVTDLKKKEQEGSWTRVKQATAYAVSFNAMVEEQSHSPTPMPAIPANVDVLLPM